jgi:2'-hydroxyisoflavone reductase
MDVLVIGGSVFLGRAMVAQAQAGGAAVTVFNRGRSAAAPEGVEQITGDRGDPHDLDQLAGRRFDVVIDTCGYVPAVVARSADLLAPRCGHYVFISSINAYPGWPEEGDYRVRGVHDGQPDASKAPDGLEEAGPYGWLKVGCERAVERAFGAERTTVLRAGLIVGPYDSATGRLPWWINRVAAGGEVLVPGAPSDTISMIDARDLALFAWRAVPGTFDAPGPAGRDTRADLMSACAAATGSKATYTYVEDAWLAAQGVEGWTEVPLWTPAAEAPSVFASFADEAIAAGLTWRAMADTVADTWAWQQRVPGGWRASDRAPGLAPERERSLLLAWHAR